MSFSDDPASRQLTYRVAFSMLKGITPELAEMILQRVGSEEEFFTRNHSLLRMQLGTDSRLLDDDYRREILEKANQETTFLEVHKNAHAIYFKDEAYPENLAQCQDAPLMLYVAGTPNLNAAHKISLVGTRSATRYGVDFINNFVKELGELLDDVLIISGLAFGCDIAAHRAALEYGIPTVAVLAHGLDNLYPTEHRREAQAMVEHQGGVLTDYPHGSPIHKGNFLARNRIVAGMADAIVVAESAAFHGGALHTANLGLLYNRDVFAVPGRMIDTFSRGCNKLIRDNVAHLLEEPKQLIEDMGWKAKPKEGTQKEMFPKLNAEQQQIVDFLRKNGDTTLQELLVLTNIPVGQLKAKLIDLEFDEVIVALPGSRFRLARS